MRVRRVLPKLKPDVNVDGHVFEEVKMFKYISTSRKELTPWS
jgi:hypothetical protein